MLVAFLVDHLYYLPQYLPVAKELQARGVEVTFRMRGAPDGWSLATRELEDLGFQVACTEDALEDLRTLAPRWVVLGNRLSGIEQLAPTTRTAMLYHGIGVKEVYYTVSECQVDVRFVEGPSRRLELERRFPGATFVDVGFAKLDCFFGPDEERPGIDLAALGLDPDRPTVLYAPTFYPSSLERMAADLPARLGDVNLVVKAHEFTWMKERYARQRELLREWSEAPGAHVAPPTAGDIRPFMGSADLLISEASSVLFEFAALDRPVVWCDFLKLRWTYRGPLSFRIKRRMDPQMARWEGIAAHVARPAHLAAIVQQELAQPAGRQAQRAEATRELIGPTDGRSAERVANYLVAES